jgi:hypothetical protein
MSENHDMNVRVLGIIALAVTLAGCAGAGPASGTVTGRPRCASGPQDERPPLYFILCIETP